MDGRHRLRGARHHPRLPAAAAGRRAHLEQPAAVRPVHLLGRLVAGRDDRHGDPRPRLVRHLLPGRQRLRMGQQIRARQGAARLAQVDRLALRRLRVHHRLRPAGQRLRIPAGGAAGARRLDRRRRRPRPALRPRKAHLVPLPVPGFRRLRRAGQDRPAALQGRPRRLGSPSGRLRAGQLRATGRRPPHDQRLRMPRLRPLRRPARRRGVELPARRSPRCSTSTPRRARRKR